MKTKMSSDIAKVSLGAESPPFEKLWGRLMGSRARSECARMKGLVWGGGAEDGVGGVLQRVGGLGSQGLDQLRE